MNPGEIAFEILDSLRDCLCARVAETRGGATCFCAIVPGEEAVADYCGCAKNIRGESGCGQAWVRLVSIYPYEAFPQQASRARCDSPLAATIEVGVYRCQPSLKGTGQAPTAVEMTEAALIATDDLEAMRKAFNCCEALTDRDYLLGRYTPRSTGGCGGGFWQATVALQRRP